jgi:predicted nucleic acid-binding protein
VSRSRLVLDTSPLIFLAKIEALQLLPALAEEMLAPAAVLEEIRTGEGRLHLERWEVPPWLEVVPDLVVPPEIAGWDLGPGESQVLAHAVTRSGWEAVLDDAEARHCARALRVPITGTLGVILRAKQAGLIPLARPLVEDLVRVGAYLPPGVTEGALRKVGE